MQSGVNQGNNLNQRMTRQKQLIMDIMENNYTHPTADEIYFAARTEDSRISRGTVYRNLNQMSEAGIIKKVSTPFGSDHFDSTLDSHYHFLCRKCQRVFDTDCPYSEFFDRQENSMEGFRVEEHRLIFIGLCPGCAE